MASDNSIDLTLLPLPLLLPGLLGTCHSLGASLQELDTEDIPSIGAYDSAVAVVGNGFVLVMVE